ncbi:MAG: hypothetical protein ACREP9_23705 [Candidatus Dormibacteraceae bacterium]
MADRRNDKRLAGFIVATATRGGAFETFCTPGQIIGWLKAAQAQVVTETAKSISLHPVFKNGHVGSETITVEIVAGSQLPTLVRVAVEHDSGPKTLNLNAIGPVSGLMHRVDETDNAWRESSASVPSNMTARPSRPADPLRAARPSPAPLASSVAPAKKPEVKTADPMSVTIEMVEALARVDDAAALVAAEALDRLSAREIVVSLSIIGERIRKARNAREIQHATMQQLRAVKMTEVMRQGVEALGYTVLVVPDGRRAMDVLRRLSAVSDPPNALRAVVEQVVVVTGRLARKFDLGIDLGEPQRIETGDVALLIELIRVGQDEEAMDLIDKLSRGKNVFPSVIRGILLFARALRGNVPRSEFIPLVDRYLKHQPHSRSVRAQAAIEELGRALYLNGDPVVVKGILQRQAADRNLSDDERTENLLSLVFATGWMAKRTKTALKM